MRTIDADALKNDFCDHCAAMEINMLKCNGQCISLRIVDAQPTVDAVPVRHEHWIERGGIFACSGCGAEDGVMTQFCSSCGAMMDGDAE